MISFAMLRKGACVGATCLLAGCSLPARVPVKDVLADQAGYLQANFSPDKMAPAVRSTITGTDNGPLGFHRMELKLTWVRQDDGKSDAAPEEQKLTLIDAGASFVQALSQHSRNGIPISQQDSLRYRGLFAVRTQGLSMTARDSGFTFIVGEVKHFDSIKPGATKLLYEYGVGFPGETSDFAPHRITCDAGSPYPATRVFASFPGNARDIQCEEYNSYGVITDKTHYAYLQHYGVAIQLHYASAKVVLDGKIVGATIE